LYILQGLILVFSALRVFFLFGASAAGRPQRPASDSVGVGGVVAKPSIMYRWEVGQEVGQEAGEDVYCVER
jgi:hypothetical protein